MSSEDVTNAFLLAGVPRQLLEAFSAYSNGRKILSTKTNDRSMRCLHGIRFISMLWIMLGHVYFSRNNSIVCKPARVFRSSGVEMRRQSVSLFPLGQSAKPERCSVMPVACGFRLGAVMMELHTTALSNADGNVA